MLGGVSGAPLHGIRPRCGMMAARRFRCRHLWMRMCGSVGPNNEKEGVKPSTV